jgi:hypothetical protein
MGMLQRRRACPIRACPITDRCGSIEFSCHLHSRRRATTSLLRILALGHALFTVKEEQRQVYIKYQCGSIEFYALFTVKKEE